MHADRQTEVAVEATINKLTDAYKRRNLEKLMECFAPDADLVLTSPGPGRARLGSDREHRNLVCLEVHLGSGDGCLGRSRWLF